jgi:hypothetical protein
MNDYTPSVVHVAAIYEATPIGDALYDRWDDEFSVVDG